MAMQLEFANEDGADIVVVNGGVKQVVADGIRASAGGAALLGRGQLERPGVEDEGRCLGQGVLGRLEHGGDVPVWAVDQEALGAGAEGCLDGAAGGGTDGDDLLETPGADETAEDAGLAWVHRIEVELEVVVVGGVGRAVGGVLPHGRGGGCGGWHRWPIDGRDKWMDGWAGRIEKRQTKAGGRSGGKRGPALYFVRPGGGWRFAVRRLGRAAQFRVRWPGAG